MSVWTWVHEFMTEAFAAEDADRIRLGDLQRQAFLHGKANPDLMLAALEEGRTLARRLNEPWWVMLFDHWRLQCHMHYLLDYRLAMDLAVRTTLEARKPQYAELPQRVCLHDDLVNTFLGVDPLGHADAIQQALDFMGGQIRDDVECRYCLLNRRRDFALVQGRLDEVEDCSRRQLAMVEDEPSASVADHHAVFAYNGLCQVALLRQDWETIREFAAAGEDRARRAEDHNYVASFLFLRALLARRDGNEAEAGRLYRKGLARRQRVQALPGFFYHDALCAFHEAGGELEKALQVRSEHLQETTGKGRLHDECECHIKRCRVLSLLGRLTAADLAAAREAAGRLRAPETFLNRLDRIERGDTGA